MNTIYINGQPFDVEGKNINVQTINGTTRITVNGSHITTLTGSDQVIVKFEGDLANLTCHNAEVNGDVRGNVTGHNVECKNVEGSVTGHNVEALVIKGNASGQNIKTDLP